MCAWADNTRRGSVALACDWMLTATRGTLTHDGGPIPKNWVVPPGQVVRRVRPLPYISRPPERRLGSLTLANSGGSVLFCLGIVVRRRVQQPGSDGRVT